MSHQDVFNEANEVIGGVTSPKMLPNYSKEKSLISEKTVITQTNKYACGIVSLTEIFNQENILYNG